MSGWLTGDIMAMLTDPVNSVEVEADSIDEIEIGDLIFNLNAWKSKDWIHGIVTGKTPKKITAVFVPNAIAPSDNEEDAVISLRSGAPVRTITFKGGIMIMRRLPGQAGLAGGPAAPPPPMARGLARGGFSMAMFKQATDMLSVPPETKARMFLVAKEGYDVAITRPKPPVPPIPAYKPGLVCKQCQQPTIIAAVDTMNVCASCGYVQALTKSELEKAKTKRKQKPPQNCPKCGDRITTFWIPVVGGKTVCGHCGYEFA